MKRLIQLFLVSAMVATFAVASVALTVNNHGLVVVQEQADEEAKAEVYKRFTDNYKTNEKIAYAAAKEYLQKYPQEDNITAYLKKWIASYEAREKAARKEQVQAFVKEQKYTEAFNLGRQVLAEEPDDLGTLTSLAWGGWLAAYGGKEAFNTEASNFARKAIQLIQEGRTVEKKDEVLGWLHAALGFFQRKSNPNEAAANFVKAAEYDGFAKKDPQLYFLLARAYEDSQYNRLANEYKTRFMTDEARASAEALALTERLKQAADLIIDALARAVAYADKDPKFQQARAEWMKLLTDYYKYRNDGSEQGLNELIAGVLTKPIPRPGQTVATPSGVQQSVPATSSGNSGSAATPASSTPEAKTASPQSVQTAAPSGRP